MSGCVSHCHLPIVPERSEKYTAGLRVFVSHHVACNECKYCLSGNHTACETLHAGNYDPGGYSEFVRVPGINVDRGVYVLPEHISFAEATMIEPLACALRGQRVIDVKKRAGCHGARQRRIGIIEYISR